MRVTPTNTTSRNRNRVHDTSLQYKIEMVSHPTQVINHAGCIGEKEERKQESEQEAKSQHLPPLLHFLHRQVPSPPSPRLSRTP